MRKRILTGMVGAAAIAVQLGLGIAKAHADDAPVMRCTVTTVDGQTYLNDCDWS